MHRIQHRTLEPIEVPIDWSSPPPEVSRWLEWAQEESSRNLDQQGKNRIGSLENSNFNIAYHVLNHIIEHRLAPGPRFCEWGSGLGIVTCLASKLGLDSSGIEIEPRLVEFSRRLSDESQLEARFHCGSYRPEDPEHRYDSRPDRFPDLDFSPSDFDIVYVYPWPAEEKSAIEWFRRGAKPGSLLVTFHGGNNLRARRLSEAAPA